MSATKARKRLTEYRRCLFSFLWNVGSDSAEITSSGREFQISGAATEKARLPTVVDMTGGTKMRFVPAERSARYHTGTKKPSVTVARLLVTHAAMWLPAWVCVSIRRLPISLCFLILMATSTLLGRPKYILSLARLMGQYYLRRRC